MALLALALLAVPAFAAPENALAVSPVRIHVACALDLDEARARARQLVDWLDRGRAFRLVLDHRVFEEFEDSKDPSEFGNAVIYIEQTLRDVYFLKRCRPAPLLARS